MRDPEQAQEDGDYTLTIVVNGEGEPEWDLVPTYLPGPGWDGSIITAEEVSELKKNKNNQED